jgi:hypothetical protein
VFHELAETGGQGPDRVLTPHTLLRRSARRVSHDQARFRYAGKCSSKQGSPRRKKREQRYDLHWTIRGAQEEGVGQEGHNEGLGTSSGWPNRTGDWSGYPPGAQRTAASVQGGGVGSTEDWPARGASGKATHSARSCKGVCEEAREEGHETLTGQEGHQKGREDHWTGLVSRFRRNFS